VEGNVPLTLSTVTSNMSGGRNMATDGAYYVTWLDPEEDPEK